MKQFRSQRSPLDFYPTPQPLCDVTCDWLKSRGMNPKNVLEPSCGSGNWIRAARRVWPGASIIANDIDPSRRKDAFAAGASGFFDYDLGGDEAHWLGEFDLVIGNPPYNAAEQHIRRCIPALTEMGVLVQLLRINFLGAQKRLQFWRDHPAAWMTPVVPRPDFSGGGGDSTEYAIYGWRREQEGPSYLVPHITWEKPSSRLTLPRNTLKAA